MHHRILRQAATLLVLSATCVAAHAADYRADWTSLSDDVVYDVHADGTYTRDVTERSRIDTDEGVRNGSQSHLSYSTSLQSLDVIEACTVTKDGRRIDVRPDQIREQQSTASSRAPMFDDQRVKVVVFPGVEPGATLVLHYRTTQKVPMFPGQFSALNAFSDDVHRVSMHLTLRAPASMPLHVDAVDLPGGRVASGSPEVQQWQWSLADRPARMPEMSSVSRLDHSPRVAITSFPDYAAIGAAYQLRAAPKAAVTPRVQALADALTQGTQDRRRQAELLYDWVSTHIRYVSIQLGFGGVVPHAADEILANAYGDCKDHVTVLEALLAAKGIRSEPVLIDLGDTYWMPKVALPLGVFDHAITWLPEFDLYVDSTAGHARFGELPASELGKSALVAGTAGKPADAADAARQGGLRTVPLGDADRGRVVVTHHMQLGTDGTLAGTSRVESGGAFELVARTLFSSMRPGLEKQAAERMLSYTAQDGTGTFRYGDPQDLGTPFVYGGDFSLPDYALLPGPGAIQVPGGLGSFDGIGLSFASAGLETRDYAIPVARRHVTEVSTIALPPGVRIPRLPKPVQVESPLGTYRAGYAIDGDTVTVTRDLVLAPPGPLVTPAEYPAYRALARAVKRDLRTQLVY